MSYRFATLFGMSPRMRIDLLVNDFVYRAVYDSALILFEAHFKRNYLQVRDAVRVFLHGIENFDQMQGQPYNVGLDDANLSKWELCEEIRRQLPHFVFLCSEIGTDPDKRNYIVSNAKIQGTGFVPEIRLATGIAELIKGYRIIKRSEYANI
jgi:nucleoside-diphosphate-sugar epimerase